MQATITINTRRKTINFLLEIDQYKLFSYISNLEYLVTHRQLNRKMIQSKVIEYVNVEGVNIEKPFTNGSETSSWWRKFVHYVENNENKMKSHPYWDTIASNGPISCELAFDEDGNYVLFDPLPSTKTDDSEDVVVIDEPPVVVIDKSHVVVIDEPVVKKVTYDEFKPVMHDQFKRTIPIIQVKSQGTKRSREEEDENVQHKRYQPITRECRYTSFCLNKYCIFVHPKNITPGPHNRKCIYGSHCNKRNKGCEFNHETK